MIGGERTPAPPRGYVSTADYKTIQLQYWAVRESLNLMLGRKKHD